MTALAINPPPSLEPFQLWPETASTAAERVDALFLFLMCVTVFFTALIFVLIVWFAIRYRRRPGHQPVQVRTRTWLEILWTLIPLGIVTVIFIWSARVYIFIQEPPANAMRLDVVGKQWMWKIQHPEGRREINEIHLPTGVPVRLVMTSEDTIHSFYLPAARVKQDVLPGRYTSLWLEPTKPGIYHLYCAEYCGTDHSKMGGKMVVMRPDEYAAWLAGTDGTITDQPPEQIGRALFTTKDCITCHGQFAPSLAGVYGSEVRLSDGSTVVADDGYLRESILAPRAKVVADWPTIMPTYRGQLSEQQVFALIAYIRSLKDATVPTTQPERPQ